MSTVKPEAFNTADAARYLGVSVDVIRGLARAGHLVPRYLTARPTYLRADLDDLLANAATEPPAKGKAS